MYLYYFTFKYESFGRTNETKFSNKTPLIFFFHVEKYSYAILFDKCFADIQIFYCINSTIPLKAFCRIDVCEMLIPFCYSIVLNELCGCEYKCCNMIHDSRPVISEYPSPISYNLQHSAARADLFK